MKEFMKKSIVTLSLSAMVLMPIRSNAVVGALTSSAAGVVLGYAVTGGAAYTGLRTMTKAKTFLQAMGGLAITVIGAYIGIVVLDGENDISLGEIDEVQQEKMGLSDQQVAVFNSELGQANMVLDTIKQEALEANLNGKEINLKWKDYSSYLSPETFEVIQAIAVQ